MITGVHAMFCSPQDEDLRIFFRDKLGLPSVDLGQGWLIFPVEGEVGFHPAANVKDDISLYCDDIEVTVDELKSRGVEFTQEVEDWGFGVGTYIAAPGQLAIQLCQPRCSVGATN
jgi:hypothetical protein